MKEVIGNLERILELTCSHGVRTKSGEVAENENQLDYTESKIRFNVIQALNAFDRAHIEKEKPKRVKVEYEKVEESIFDLRKDFESGCLFGDSSGVVKVDCLAYLGASCETGNIYRRVETEISERDEFIAESMKIAEMEKTHDIEVFFGSLFDSGKFKLVEGD